MKIKELTAKDIKNIMMDKALIIVLVFMIIGIIIIEPSFLQIRVLTDILTQSAVKMICALGLMFALLLGGTNYEEEIFKSGPGSRYGGIPVPDGGLFQQVLAWPA